jgi:DUF1365 family protein
MFVRDLECRSKMENAVYRGELFHHRTFPVKHSFKYAHACLFTDIEKIPDIADISPLVSIERPNLLSFYRQDFLPSERTLYEEVCFRIDDQTGEAFAGKVYLLANWRTCGSIMNPLALFYCYEDGVLRYVVGEVHNTPWNERHVYVLDVANSPLTSEKSFHVSPFMPMGLRYEWGVDSPGQKLNVCINADEQGKKIFSVTMKLESQPLTKTSLHKMVGSFPMMAARTLMLIYYQAFRLWLKRVPIYFHPGKI